MKKTYEKPMALFEDYRLSANIAASCEVSSNFSANSCGFVVPGIGTVFVSGVQGCEYTASDGDYSICYHVPVESSNLFSS